jgi:hypothetical protein
VTRPAAPAAPTVHLNGTGRAQLVEPLQAAARALRAAIAAVEDAAPNARDYYPQGPGAFERARSEHVARLARLQAVLGELSAVWESIEGVS